MYSVWNPHRSEKSIEKESLRKENRTRWCKALKGKREQETLNEVGKRAMYEKNTENLG